MPSGRRSSEVAPSLIESDDVSDLAEHDQSGCPWIREHSCNRGVSRRKLGGVGVESVTRAIRGAIHERYDNGNGI